MTSVKLVALAALCALCAACGSASQRRVTHGLTSWRASSTGAVLFAHNCARCHSLIGNESQRKQGGDLVPYRMTRQQLALMTRTMPTRPLSDAEVRAIVAYVYAAQRRRGS